MAKFKPLIKDEATRLHELETQVINSILDKMDFEYTDFFDEEDANEYMELVNRDSDDEIYNI